MMHWRVGTITGRERAWGRAVQYAVTLSSPQAEVVRALGYVDLVGELAPGDRVLLSTSALERGLGTGGLAFVVAAPDRLPADPPAAPGHIVKARYTPQQQLVLAIDEQESPHHEAFLSGPAADGDLGGIPVLAADLHSALAPILVGIRALHPDLRVAYLMTDGGALPAAFSMTIARLREVGWLTATITVGQAYGGDHEAVTLHSGLLAARHVLGADVAVVTQGPGNVGTGTAFGFTGVAAGEALNAAHVLGGRPIGALRISDADARERHYGISHHSRTAYGRIVLGAASLVLPRLGGEFGELVETQAQAIVQDASGRLDLIAEETDGLLEALSESPVGLSSMGRGVDRDEAYFVSHAAAGRAVARLASR
ncbi:MAG: DUF3866 family protein [Actinobacteria bacterium]|nr:DUF3866 family protein [Actinomycetota bacterium]